MARILNRIHWWFYNQFFDVMKQPKIIIHPDGSKESNPFGGY